MLVPPPPHPGSLAIKVTLKCSRQDLGSRSLLSHTLSSHSPSSPDHKREGQEALEAERTHAFPRHERVRTEETATTTQVERKEGNRKHGMKKYTHRSFSPMRNFCQTGGPFLFHQVYIQKFFSTQHFCSSDFQRTLELDSRVFQLGQVPLCFGF